ncbi:nickel-dependent hydrogenase large subunit [Candidatus Poribacteria bacterium]|nr:nickel-dependent hydrogenase large subunit [Candidatus Poribacteria bacterium]
MNSRTIKADYLARVEGEGAMFIKIRGGKVADVKLKIFEPPRFFEAFLRGRSFLEAPDITARICGICPIAYQLGAVHAMETICGVQVGGQLRALRRLIYCGEWIESHALHIFMLHAPDFLGYESAIHMAKDHQAVVEMALRLKKTGNELMKVIGGREVHPINVRVGGFYRVPSRRELLALKPDLEWGRDASLKTLDLVSGFKFPEFEQDYEFVCLSHPDEYPFNEGRLVSNKGLDIAISQFPEHFEEEHVEHSNALHCSRKGHGNYFVGPMARYSIEGKKLPALARQAARKAGLGDECRNPFKSIIVRAVEMLYAFDEALRLINAYEPPDAPFIEVQPAAGTGCGCTEAPRGICWHQYTIGADGLIQKAWIVPPTSQNQKTIEKDLYWYVSRNVNLVDEALKWQCEQAIRNYDPCISCATHFLRLELDRGT